MQTVFRILLTSVMASLLMASPAYAYLSFGLAGSGSTTHGGWEVKDEMSASGTISLDLGSYFRIGYTHRQSREQKDGYKFTSTSSGQIGYYEFQSNVRTIANSVDLTLVLYQGELLTPFIFGGIACKKYLVKSLDLNGTTQYEVPDCPVPNGGFGLAFTLNQNFSLRFSRTYSPGQVYSPTGEKPRNVLDSYSQVGITYKL